MSRLGKVLVAAAAVLVLAGATVVLASRSDESDGAASSPPEPEPASDVPLAKSSYSNVFTVDVVGHSLDEVTQGDDTFARDVDWSARGGIAFVQAPPSEYARLFTVSADGSAKREVPTRATHLFHPTWSPDGRQIAVVRLGRAIYVIDPRTGSSRRLRGTGKRDNAPRWSPDGKTIVFERQLSPTNWDLFTVRAAGGGLRRLTRDRLQQVNATWAPDGESLAFAEQQRTGNWALVRMRRDGSARKLLTDPNVSIQEPAWSPRGDRIACVLQEGDRASIALIASEGGEPVRITTKTVVASHPSWSADGRKIAFTAQSVVRPAPSPPPGPQG